VSTRDEAIGALQHAWSQQAPTIVELVTVRADNLGRHRAVQAVVTQAVEASLAG
jgi:hypothetical protein